MNTWKYLPLMAMIAMLLSACKKDSPQDAIDAELAKLPPITQTGANTFGCLVNGKAVTPNSSCPNCPPLNADFDNSTNGGFGITCYYDNGTKAIIIGVDSIFTYQKAIINDSINKNVRVAVFNRLLPDSCQYSGYLLSQGAFTSISGEVNFSRIDVTKGIFAGTFFFTIKTNTCGNYEVTNGRFDYKF